MRSQVCFAALAFVAGASAQNFAYSPAGAATVEGSNNNTIPLWSTSATYMQIHDEENMSATLGGRPTTLLGLTLRKDFGGSTVVGRSMMLQLTVAATLVTTRSATNSFASNLGTGATIVLPYGQVSFPNLADTARPNPPGIVLPFATPFPFTPSPGVSFCWEWRHHTASANAISPLDAVNMNDAESPANEGVGCLTAGQTQPATILLRQLDLRLQTFRHQLTRAAANAGAVFVLGGQRANLQLPGQCAPLLTNPLAFFPGVTDSAGDWDLVLPTPDLRPSGRAELLGQFAWVDANQPTGLGLSDLAVSVTPLRGAYYMARFYAAPFGGGAGFETAAFATGSDLGYGLVVGFMTP